MTGKRRVPLLGHGISFDLDGRCVVVDATAYQLDASDDGAVVSFTSSDAVTLTIPAGLDEGFSCVIVQSGDGVVTPTIDGTTLHSRGGFTGTAGQYAVCALLCVAENVFIFAGDRA